MKGHNELRVCPAEAITAFQEYIQKRMPYFAPTVDGVREDKASGVFIVSLVEKKPKE